MLDRCFIACEVNSTEVTTVAASSALQWPHAIVLSSAGRSNSAHHCESRRRFVAVRCVFFAAAWTQWAADAGTTTWCHQSSCSLLCTEFVSCCRSCMARRHSKRWHHGLGQASHNTVHVALLRTGLEASNSRSAADVPYARARGLSALALLCAPAAAAATLLLHHHTAFRCQMNNVQARASVRRWVVAGAARCATARPTVVTVQLSREV